MLHSSHHSIILRTLLALILLLPGAASALQDQGLASIMSIIDKAMQQYSDKMQQEFASDEDRQLAAQVSADAVVNLSRTLGKLSYSRLQCGQTEVLAEFTQRVQQMPDMYRDPMRDAFQQGFDQSRQETALLSEDECERLTQSRNLGERAPQANVEQPAAERATAEPEPPEDPNLKHLRIAELSGQLAFKKKFCGDDRVVTRDYNELIGNMPPEIQAEAKEAYWSGYQHGKRLNKNLNQDQCQ
ncbi:MAG: hypothetical protein QNJ69_05980 [Gammaproteobacteria bacterium]|nr:hypothetical protein [Gammaproteobacteria bacterium]